MNLLHSLKLPALLCMTLGIVACGDKAPSATEANAPQQTETFKSKLPDNAPIVKVVTSGVMPPFSYLDTYGNIQGIDVDVIRAIGENQGFKVEIFTQRFDKMFLGLENKTYQAVISNTSFTPDRASKYGHSDSYLSNAPAIMFKPDINVKSLSDLAGLKVATMHGTTHNAAIARLGTTKIHDNLNSVFALYQTLLQDKYDAVLEDQLLLEYHASNHPEYKVKVITYVPASDPSTQLVIYTQKHDTALISKLNKGIANLKADGTIDKIKGKYIKVSEN